MYNPMFRPVLKLIWPHLQKLRLRDSWREQLQSCLERSFKPWATSDWVAGWLKDLSRSFARKIIYRICKLSHVWKRWCKHVDLLGRQWTYHLDCVFINIRRYATNLMYINLITTHLDNRFEQPWYTEPIYSMGMFRVRQWYMIQPIIWSWWHRFVQ